MAKSTDEKVDTAKLKKKIAKDRQQCIQYIEDNAKKIIDYDRNKLHYSDVQIVQDIRKGINFNQLDKDQLEVLKDAFTKAFQS